MLSWRSTILLVAIAGAAASTTAHAKPWQRAREKLEGVLRKELGLTQSSADVHRALTLLDRERSSLQYTATVLDHAGSETTRRLTAYRKLRSSRDAVARSRGRALYKLSRGGLARLAFEGIGEGTGEGRGDRVDDTAARVVRGRMLRFVVSHDLEQLAIHQRAEQRASRELVAANRELQSLGAITMVEGMQAHVLVSAEQTLDPQLRATLRTRRRVAARVEDKANKANRGLLAQVKSNWRELRALRGLDGSASLVRPVRGKVIGRFGAYDDKVLRLPMVRNGVELAAKRNEPVRAMADGVVVLVTKLPGYDDVVVVDHGGGQFTLTARIWDIAVTEGDTVEGGDVLARVAPKAIDDGLGRTVYVELRHGEKPVDPSQYLKRARR